MAKSTTTTPRRSVNGKAEKAEQKKWLSAEGKVTVTLECSGCDCTVEHEDDLAGLEASEIQDAAAEHFYREGWRRTSSEALGLIGILCPECTKHKDNPKSKHWEF